MSIGSQENDGSQGHPAWQVILDKLPDNLHPLIKPELEAMDKRVQDKLQELHGSYDPYKKFAENNVDPQIIEQALYLANHLQSDPAGFVQRAIDNFNLEQYKQQVQQAAAEEELDDWDGDDFTKHPQFKALADQITSLQGKLTEREQQEQLTQQQQEVEDYLDQLETQHGEFDRLYVASMLANNIDGPQAVKQYQDMVNQAALKLTSGNGTVQQQQQEQQVPVVMGAAGTAGSGSPNEPVSMGSLKGGEVMDMVTQMLEQAAKNE